MLLSKNAIQFMLVKTKFVLGELKFRGRHNAQGGWRL